MSLSRLKLYLGFICVHGSSYSGECNGSNTMNLLLLLLLCEPLLFISDKLT